MGQWMCEWLVWAHGWERSYATILPQELIRFGKANQRWYREGRVLVGQGVRE